MNREKLPNTKCSCKHVFGHCVGGSVYFEHHSLKCGTSSPVPHFNKRPLKYTLPPAQWPNTCLREYFVFDSSSLFISILKRIGPNIEPCGTPDKIFWNALKMLFILAFCFRSLKYVIVIETQSLKL